MYCDQVGFIPEIHGLFNTQYERGKYVVRDDF